MSAVPSAYVPATNFNSLLAANAGVFPSNGGVNLDAEWAALQVWTAAQQARINLIQRSDGALQTKVVSLDALGTDVVAALGGSGLNGRGAWVTLTAYAKGDVVTSSGISYLCVTAHTSAAAFATDLAAVKWISISYSLTSGAINSSSFFAAQVVDNTALGLLSVATGNLQDASVTTGKLADASVTTAKHADASVTTAKLADGSVTATKLAAGVAPSVVVSAANSANTVSASPLNHPTLFLPIAAGQVMLVQLDLIVGCSGAGGTTVNLTAPSGATFNTTSGLYTTTVGALGLATNLGSTGITPIAQSTQGIVIGASVVVTNGSTPGNVQLTLAPVTNAQTATVYAGSKMRGQ